MMSIDERLERRRERERLMAFLKRGGRLLREDYGGAVGVAWRRAHRGASGFDTDACERLLRDGCKVAAEAHKLVRAPFTPEGIFLLEKADEEPPISSAIQTTDKFPG